MVAFYYSFAVSLVILNLITIGCILLPLEVWVVAYPSLDMFISDSLLRFRRNLLEDFNANISFFDLSLTIVRHTIALCFSFGKETVCLAFLIHYSPTIKGITLDDEP